MAGYWPSYFFACLWTETKAKSINTPISSHLEAWSIKDLLYGFWGNFSCGTRRVVPSGQDGSILPAGVTNRSAGFDSSCPLAELAI